MCMKRGDKGERENEREKKRARRREEETNLFCSFLGSNAASDVSRIYCIQINKMLRHVLQYYALIESLLFFLLLQYKTLLHFILIAFVLISAVLLCTNSKRFIIWYV